MDTKEMKEIHLIGISLPGKTTNEQGQSAIDCGNLWQKFLTEGYATRIPAKLSDEMLAVYYDYEGDHTKPFAYFIGCKVASGATPPEGMIRLTIPSGDYRLFIAKGRMPDCIADCWKAIWESDINRAYSYDFEVYGEKSKDWNDAEVDVYISI